jgi:hypothetical protein
MAPFGFFDVLILAIGGHFVVKIITTWLKTREGVTRRHVQQLEQRLRALETQQVADLHKRLSVLEEAFVLDDMALQRQLHQAVGDDPRVAASPPPNGSPPQHEREPLSYTPKHLAEKMRHVHSAWGSTVGSLSLDRLAITSAWTTRQLATPPIWRLGFSKSRSLGPSGTGDYRESQSLLEALT